jgi:uncharacterized protein YdeI (YjbR/CyaY-like superfamily)
MIEKIDHPEGKLHELPSDMQQALEDNPDTFANRNKLTPLARNEWICRVTIVKKVETREDHIKRLVEDVREGEKRPCCRPGCPHRRESAKKWFKQLR